MQSSERLSSTSRLREPLLEEDALAWPMREECTSQRGGSKGRRREGKDPASKGKDPQNPPGGREGMSLNTVEEDPTYISPHKDTPNSCPLETYSGAGVTGIL